MLTDFPALFLNWRFYFRMLNGEIRSTVSLSGFSHYYYFRFKRQWAKRASRIFQTPVVNNNFLLLGFRQHVVCFVERVGRHVFLSAVSLSPLFQWTPRDKSHLSGRRIRLLTALHFHVFFFCLVHISRKALKSWPIDSDGHNWHRHSRPDVHCVSAVLVIFGRPDVSN